MKMSSRATLHVLLLVTSPFASFRYASAQDVETDTAAVQPVVEEGVDYIVYDRQGRRSSARSIVSAAMGDDVLLIGEEHDDMVGHAFQTLIFNTVLEEVGPVAGSGRPVVLSLEMFERDVQYVLDEYLDDQISEAHFLKSSRPWDAYQARYRPAVESAREHGASVVAANAPRRYVSRVTAHGPESLLTLSAQARAYLPPLPYPGPSRVYREQWDALMTAAMLGMEEDAAEAGTAEEGAAEAGTAEAGTIEEGAAADGAGEGEDVGDAQSSRYGMTPYAIYSQALWDASMGHAITEALVRHVGGFVVHFAGSFHVERDTGIVERIADYRPGTRVTTVVMTKVDDIGAWSAEEHAALADYVVLTRRPEAQEH
jgi:uncharacterized iron-regulated protein